MAARALTEFGAALAAEVDRAAPPGQQLAAVAGAYVRFAAEHRPLFEVLFGAGLDKARHPELQRAAGPVTAMLLGLARSLAGGDAAARTLVTAVAATAHGHAALLADGMFGHGESAVATAAGQARAAALAIVAGRAALA